MQKNSFWVLLCKKKIRRAILMWGSHLICKWACSHSLQWVCLTLKALAGQILEESFSLSSYKSMSMCRIGIKGLILVPLGWLSKATYGPERAFSPFLGVFSNYSTLKSRLSLVKKSFLILLLTKLMCKAILYT